MVVLLPSYIRRQMAPKLSPLESTFKIIPTAANDAVIDLLNSGALDKVSNPPALLFVSHIVNSTGQQVDTDLLTQKITKALLDSGKAMITTTDPAAIGLHQEKDFMADTNTTRLADFTLSGRIIETIDRAGNTRRRPTLFNSR